VRVHVTETKDVRLAFMSDFHVYGVSAGFGGCESWYHAVSIWFVDIEIVRIPWCISSSIYGFSSSSDRCNKSSGARFRGILVVDRSSLPGFSLLHGSAVELVHGRDTKDILVSVSMLCTWLLSGFSRS